MPTWTRQPQEQDDQKYFFNGSFYATTRVAEALTKEEISFIFNYVRRFAQEKNGIDYLQSYVSDAGQTVWVIDELDQHMIESGEYEAENNLCTLLFPEER